MMIIIMIEVWRFLWCRKDSSTNSKNKQANKEDLKDLSLCRHGNSVSNMWQFNCLHDVCNN